MKFYLGLFLLLAACSKPSTKLVQQHEPPPPPERHLALKDQYKLPKVDILFVIDDSGSMLDHQTRLAANIDLFLAGMFANSVLDYRIGVLNSSVNYCWRPGCSGQLRKQFVDRNTPGAQGKLRAFLQPGTDGNADEKFFDPIWLALSQPLLGDSAIGSMDFYRPEAHLATIFVTDSDNQSNISPQAFYNFLLGLKNGDAIKIHSYGAIIPSSDRSCKRSGEPKPTEIEEFFRLSGGKFFGLCDPDFGSRLSDLQKDLAATIGRYVYLDRLPVARTITVKFGTQVIPNDPIVGWLYDPSKNALVFGPNVEFSNQPQGTELEVFFEPLD